MSFTEKKEKEWAKMEIQIAADRRNESINEWVLCVRERDGEGGSEAMCAQQACLCA